MEQSPEDTALAAKVANARSQAVAQAVGIIKRCQIEDDFECVNRESSFVIELDPANAKAGAARHEARAALAQRALASAKAAATRKDFAEALRSTKEAVKLRPDSDVRAQAADVVKGFSADATTAGAEIVNVQDPSAMNAVSVLKSWVAVLEETVPYHPDQAPTLATAKAKLAEAKGIEQAREEAQSREREAAAAVARAAEQKARADRSRTFSLVGAIVSPGKSDGKNWDGFGTANAEVLSKVASALAGSNPYTAVASVLATPFAEFTSTPDTAGHVQLFLGGIPSQPVRLAKIENSLTPQWTGMTWPGIDILRTRVRVTLVDKDLQLDDPMGTIEIGPTELQNALQNGVVSWVDVRSQTQDQVLLLGISVQ